MHSLSTDETINKIAAHVEEILRLLGENPEREGLKKTPLRNAKALYHLTQGYRENADDILRQAIFEYAGSRMVIVKDIEFYSMCEHHILPFFGKVSIGYIPDSEMIGLSKLARLVNTFARRLQVQERLTYQIAQALTTGLKCKGVIVHCEARHMCMMMRGVEKQESSTSTVDYTGVFAEDSSLRQEFFNSIK